MEKVAPDGTLTRLAGNGTLSIDYGKALAGIGEPVRVDLGPQGQVYVRTNDFDNPAHVGSDVRIVRIEPDDGTVSPIAGLNREPEGCTSCLTHTGEQAQATLIDSNSNGLGVLPDGDVVYTDGRYQVIRIGSALPGFQPGTTIVPAQDGSQAYVFDAQGRHLKTLDGTTGATLWTFGYDAQSRLVSATDGDGNTIAIRRDAAGAPTAIVAPGGETTALALDADGRLKSVTNPAGEATAFTYHPGTGLLDTFTRPGGLTSSYDFDADGRLIRAESPTGRVQRLARSGDTDQTTVTVTSGEGRDTLYKSQALPSGDRVRTITTPDGEVTTLTVHPDGSRTPSSRTAPVDQVSGPDPRWGMRAPMPVDETTTTPAGRSCTSPRAARRRSPTRPTPSPTPPRRRRSPPTRARRPRRPTTAPTGRSPCDAPSGNTRTTQMDAQGRVTSVTSGSGQDPLTFAYGPNGLVTKTAQGTQSMTYAYDAGRPARRPHRRGRQERRLHLRRGRPRAHARRSRAAAPTRTPTRRGRRRSPRRTAASTASRSTGTATSRATRHPGAIPPTSRRSTTRTRSRARRSPAAPRARSPATPRAGWRPAPTGAPSTTRSATPPGTRGPRPRCATARRWASPTTASSRRRTRSAARRPAPSTTRPAPTCS